MADTSFTSRALNTALSALTQVPSGLSAAYWTSTTGTAGTYTYVVTAFNGGETIASTGVSFTNTSASGVAISFSGVPGATNYRLYRSGAGSTGYQWVANSESSPIYDAFPLTLGDYVPNVNTTAIESRALGTQPTTFYSVPNATRTLFKEAIMTNTHSDTLSFTLYLVPSGEVASRGNVAFNAVTLEANETKILSLNSVMDPGDSIQAKSSDIGMAAGYGAITIKISGIEISDN